MHLEKWEVLIIIAVQICLHVLHLLLWQVWCCFEVVLICGQLASHELGETGALFEGPKRWFKNDFFQDVVPKAYGL